MVESMIYVIYFMYTVIYDHLLSLHNIHAKVEESRSEINVLCDTVALV